MAASLVPVSETATVTGSRLLRLPPMLPAVEAEPLVLDARRASRGEGLSHAEYRLKGSFAHELPTGAH